MIISKHFEKFDKEVYVSGCSSLHLHLLPISKLHTWRNNPRHTPDTHRNGIEQNEVVIDSTSQKRFLKSKSSPPGFYNGWRFSSHHL